MKADVNVIDMDALHIHAPEMVYDLSAEGRRLVQKADGHRYTICSGEVTCEYGSPTGTLPGKLVRGRQSLPASLGWETTVAESTRRMKPIERSPLFFFDQDLAIAAGPGVLGPVGCWDARRLVVDDHEFIVYKPKGQDVTIR